MNNIPTTGELFATNQVSANTERRYKRQLHNFAEWMADSRDVRDMESVSTADLLAYRQSIQQLAASSQNRYLAAMSQNLFELIEHNNIHLYASVELRHHASHCVAVESTRGRRISKQKAANKIDGIVALAMACLHAVQTSNRAPLVIAVI